MSHLGWCFMCGDDLDATGWVELYPCLHVMCPHCLCCREALRGCKPLFCPQKGCGVPVQTHCYTKARGVHKNGSKPGCRQTIVKHHYGLGGPTTDTIEMPDNSNGEKQESRNLKTDILNSTTRLSRSRCPPARFSDFVSHQTTKRSIASVLDTPGEEAMNNKQVSNSEESTQTHPQTTTQEGSVLENEGKEEELGTPNLRRHLAHSRRPPARLSNFEWREILTKAMSLRSMQKQDTGSAEISNDKQESDNTDEDTVESSESASERMEIPEQEEVVAPVSTGRMTRSRHPPDRFSSSAHSVPAEVKERKKKKSDMEDANGGSKSSSSPVSAVTQFEAEAHQREILPIASIPNPPMIEVPHYMHYPPIPCHCPPQCATQHGGFGHEQMRMRMDAPAIPRMNMDDDRCTQKNTPAISKKVKGADRRDRNNAASRARCAKLKETVMKLKEKSEDELTENEKMTLSNFEDRRLRKNLKSKERAIEKKMEMERILAKPKSKRTKKENQFLTTILLAKRRKNMGDRIRRKRLKLSPNNTPTHHEAAPPELGFPLPGQGRRAPGYPSCSGNAQVSPQPTHLLPYSRIVSKFGPVPHPIPPLHPSPPPPAVHEEGTRPQHYDPSEGRNLRYPHTGHAPGAGIEAMPPGHKSSSYLRPPHRDNGTHDTSVAPSYFAGLHKGSSTTQAIFNDEYFLALVQNAESENNTTRKANATSRTVQSTFAGLDSPFSVPNASIVATEAITREDQKDSSAGVCFEIPYSPSIDSADSQLIVAGDIVAV